MLEAGIRYTHERLKQKLKAYLKAQYFAENELLLEAVDELMDMPEVLFQEPYIEATNSYKIWQEGFAKVEVPIPEVKDYLQMLASRQLGVFDTPFYHQTEAIQYYYQGNDLLVTTGTGSGKTECFLWPILTDLMLEAGRSPQSWKQEGIRTLVLYPMNALVSDQLGRIRTIIGRQDDTYMELIRSIAGNHVRRPRFGMYTGRTPYASAKNEKRDKELAKKLKAAYINGDSKVRDQLLNAGRMPSKDLVAFVQALESSRHEPAVDDAELFIRGEMQTICPDILITNYSMLEHMLMRSIEQDIWHKTTHWLKASPDNKLLLVIDEAHMYRGAAGGEVSLLIRRLLDKLEITREKLKCILTTASVPEGRDEELQQFACALTGQDKQSATFRVIRGERESVISEGKITVRDVEQLAALNYDRLRGSEADIREELSKLAVGIAWDSPSNNLSKWLYEKLSHYPPMMEIVKLCRGKAVAFKQIVATVFAEFEPTSAEKTTEILLLLGTMAKSQEDKVLLPSRVHMMFRGLNGIFACLNPECPDARSADGVTLGRIYDRFDRYECQCGSRLFELVGDRRCGTLFIRAYKDQAVDENFLWQEPSPLIQRPEEIHLWILPKGRLEAGDIFKEDNESRQKKESQGGYLDTKTGKYHQGKPSRNKGCISVLIPPVHKQKHNRSFTTCPNCGRDHVEPTPFRTRGNEPFANIVTEQFDTQPIRDPELKNHGKKVLLFSDSRQRAATLARDLTIATDGDAGRQALFMAAKLLERKYGQGTTSVKFLYYAFLDIIDEHQLGFFYGDERERLQEQLKLYRDLYNNKPTKNYKRMEDRLGSPPKMFYQLLLKNISDSYRSLHNLCLAQMVLIEDGEEGEHLEEDILEDIARSTKLPVSQVRDIYNTWIQHTIVKDIAIFPDLNDEVRQSILAYEKTTFGAEPDRFPKILLNLLNKHLNNDQIKHIQQGIPLLTDTSTVIGSNSGRRFLYPVNLTLKTAENAKWYRCRRCSGTSTFILFECCIHCGSKNHLHELRNDEMDRYDYWRQPVIQTVGGKTISNLVTAEHTAQLSHKDPAGNLGVTTEKYELLFRNIPVEGDSEPVDILSCTTTMEVGIDIGSLTAVGLRNVPPMRENYQQRAGRAGRKGAAVSTIVTYSENGPHDAWYFNRPYDIIAGSPRTPWIDWKNIKLAERHMNLVLLKDYFLACKEELTAFEAHIFFSTEATLNINDFCKWVDRHIPLDHARLRILLPEGIDFPWDRYRHNVREELLRLQTIVQNAPEMYRKQQVEETNNQSANQEKYLLLNVLFEAGFLPTYSFPRNIVRFWIEDHQGKVQESPERSIDIALSEYAPGRILVVDKKSYISGGLYDHYSKRISEYKYKAAERWMKMEDYRKTVLCCSNKNCGWFGTNQHDQHCPLCGEQLNGHTMVKPWGFTPRDGRHIPEVRETQEYSAASIPSYSSMPQDVSRMQPIFSKGLLKLESRGNQKLVILNRGPGYKGFDLCGKCGAIDPAEVSDADKSNRKRPYRVLYSNNDNQTCAHRRETVFLGHEFTTDMVVLEIKLDGEKIDILPDHEVIWLRPALSTFAESFALASSQVLDVEFSDLKCGYRIRRQENTVFADVYLYDSLSSGAGYSNRVENIIDEVLKEMESRLLACNCGASCPRCVRHFWNAALHTQLDRHAALQLLYWVRDGKIADQLHVQQQYDCLKSIDKVIRLHKEQNRIYSDQSCCRMEYDGHTQPIMVYPAMMSLSSLSRANANCVMVPDRLLKLAIQSAWDVIRKQLES